MVKNYNINCRLHCHINCIFLMKYFFKLKMGSNNKPINQQRVRQIEDLINRGASHREISRSIGVSLGAISKIRKNMQNSPDKNKGGRTKILSPAQERKILIDLRRQKYQTASEIQRSLTRDDHINISTETVRRTLRRAGLRGRAKVKKPLLTKRHQKLRLNFAKTYAHWTSEDWAKVIWSDETKINRLGSDGRQWVWRTPGEKLQPQHVQPTLKFGGGSIMVWGCMMAQGVGTLHLILGRMTAASYIDILDVELFASMTKLEVRASDIVFQQDNDPKHNARITKNWLEQKNLVTLIWPPQSPDLNPIEHLWGVLKRSVTGVSGGVNELWQKVQLSWNEISPEMCKTLVESMPRRIQAVLEAKGGYTKY